MPARTLNPSRPRPRRLCCTFPPTTSVYARVAGQPGARPGPQRPQPRRGRRARPRPRGAPPLGGARLPGPAQRLPTVPARPPAASRVGAGRRRQPLLKFESHDQRVRNPEIPDPLLRVLSPEAERRAAGARRTRAPAAARGTRHPAGPRRPEPRSSYRAACAPAPHKGEARCPWCPKLFIKLCVYLWVKFVRLVFVWKNIVRGQCGHGGKMHFF